MTVDATGRVALLGPYPPPWGGVQTHIASIKDRLDRMSVACTVLNITRHRDDPQPGVVYPKSAFELLWQLRALRPTAVHLHVGGHFTRRVQLLALACSSLPRARTLFTLHSGGYPSTPEGRAARPRSLAGVALRRYDGLIAVNAEIADVFERFGALPSQIHTIAPHPPDADIRRIAMDARSGREDVERFMATHHPALVTVGLLEPEYNLTLQMRALARVREAYPNAGLVIIGSGSLESDLRSCARSLPWYPHIMIAGDVARAATLRAIRQADLMVRTTSYDGDAVSIREALALGTRVVATDNGARPSGIVLTPVGDEAALVSATIAALSSPVPAVKGDGAPDPIGRVLELYRIAA
jgi:glycosyltransferase involved in cell wall biosynthesis